MSWFTPWHHALAVMCVLLGSACWFASKWNFRYQRPMAEPHISTRRNGTERAGRFE